MAGGTVEVWPAAGRALLDELAAARGRVALIAGRPEEAESLVNQLKSDLGLDVVQLGLALASRSQPPLIADVDRACNGAAIIADIDVLMWPDVHVAPLQLLAKLALRRPTVAVWPGEIMGGRAIYSMPGRPDHHDITLRNVIVLRPRQTRFPDEVPFEIERILP